MTSKIFAFDFDGVLINSLPCMEHSWDHTCKAFDIKIPFESFRPHIGLPFMEILANLSIYANKHAFYDAYFSYSRYYTSLIELYPGVYEALLGLSRNVDSHVAIVTSKPRHRSLELISKFNLPIDILLSPEDTPRGKPFPDPLNYLSSLWPSPSSNLFFFGDMPSDHLCAANALWNFIYCEWGYGSFKSDLEYPFQSLTTPSQLSQFLLTISQPT